MIARTSIAAMSLLSLAACIAPSVVDPLDRARADTTEEQVWHPANGEDIPGTYVSVKFTGPLSSALRKVIYFFEPNGQYSAAALLEGTPPHFEVIAGQWHVQGNALTLDTAAPAQLEVSEHHYLRFTGDEGQVVLRREIDQ